MLEQQVAARKLQSQEYGSNKQGVRSNKTDEWVANRAPEREPIAAGAGLLRVYFIVDLRCQDLP